MGSAGQREAGRRSGGVSQCAGSRRALTRRAPTDGPDGAHQPASRGTTPTKPNEVIRAIMLEDSLCFLHGLHGLG